MIDKSRFWPCICGDPNQPEQMCDLACNKRKISSDEFRGQPTPTLDDWKRDVDKDSRFGNPITICRGCHLAERTRHPDRIYNFLGSVITVMYKTCNEHENENYTSGLMSCLEADLLEMKSWSEDSGE